MTDRVEVDLSNRSAAVVVDGRCVALYSGVTRSTVAERVRPDGWRVTGEWALLSPPDGFWSAVTRGLDAPN